MARCIARGFGTVCGRDARLEYRFSSVEVAIQHAVCSARYSTCPACARVVLEELGYAVRPPLVIDVEAFPGGRHAA